MSLKQSQALFQGGWPTGILHIESQREPKEYNRDERCYLINRETDEINIRLSDTLSEKTENKPTQI